MDQGNLKDKVLAQMMNKGTKVYSMNDALQWVIEVACALHYLHAICRPMIIHRDLKLENILLSGNPPVVCLCFSSIALCDVELNTHNVFLFISA